MSVSTLKISDFIALNRPYNLTIAPLPKKGVGHDELITVQYNFKPPVDVTKQGRVTVEKPGNKWTLEQAPMDLETTTNEVRFEGVGKKSRNETLLVWKGPDVGFVVTKVETSVIVSHIRDTHPTYIPQRAPQNFRKPAKSKTAVGKKKSIAQLKKSNEYQDGDEALLGSDNEREDIEARPRNQKHASRKRESKLVADEKNSDEDYQICNICQADDNDSDLLLCDNKDCSLAEHFYCTFPSLDALPEGDWFCSNCNQELK